MLQFVLTFIYVFVCFLLLLVVLLQQGKGGDIASAFGGSSSQAAFGARSGATLLTKATTVLGVLFMLGALGLAIVYERGPSSSVLSGRGGAVQTTPKKAPTPKAPAPAPAPKKDEARPAAPAPAAATAPVAPRPIAEAPAAKPKNHPKAIEIINKYLDAIGGAKVLESITDRTQKFRNTKHAASGDTVAALNQYIKKGYKVREEWNIEGVKIKDNPLAFTQVYNGSDGWVQMFGTVSALEGRTLSLFVWDKFLDDAFCHWEEDGNSVDYIGPGTVDGEPAEIIEMSDFTNSKKERYFFSKNTGLLIKKEWKEQGQNSTGLAKKEIAYKKYKPIPFADGSGKTLQYPLLHEVYEDGDVDTTREFTEMKINSGLQDAIFERPEGVEFKPNMIGQGFPGEKKDGAAQKAPAPATPGGARTTPPPAHPSLPPAHPPVGATPAPAPAPVPAPKAEAK